MKLFLVVVIFVLFPSISMANNVYITCSYEDPYRYTRIARITYICSEVNEKILFNFTNPQALTCSNLDGNQVSRDNVRKINFEMCKMPKLNCDYLEKYNTIRELNVSYTGLEQLNKEAFNKAQQLRKFNASHNDIASIPALLFHNAENLEEVDFSYNKIQRFDSFALSGAKKLTKLDFSYNLLVCIKADYFDSVLNLLYLNLSHNSISEVAPDAFKVLSKLNTLDLSFNSIKVTKSNMFEGLAGLVNLVLVQLSNETIDVEPLTFNHLNSLKMLNLSNNHIEKIEQNTFYNLSKLSTLIFAPVQIDMMDRFGFAGINNIKELNLSRSNSFAKNRTIIDKDAFYNFTSLVSLNLANNRIENLNVGTFYKLQNLQHLNLSNIHLTEIRFGTFSQSKTLLTLDLSKNFLKKFDFANFLPVYYQFRKFYLNGNRLTELQEFRRSLVPNLSVLDLTDNSFNCTYLKNFLFILLSDLKTMEVSSQISFNPYEVNIQGVRCIPMIDEISNNGNIMNQSEAIAIATTEPTVNNDVKMVHENSTNINLEEIEKKQTTALSALAQAQNDLHTMKILQIFMSAMLASIFIVILILVIVNRINLINIPRYRDQSVK